MIRFTVLWRREAEDELTALWCDSSNRKAITAASDQIDAELRLNAHEKGIDFPGGLRALSIKPLVAFFRVDEGDRKVFVEVVRLTSVD